MLKLLDVIKVVRADEQNHSEVNHGRADSLGNSGDQKISKTRT
jgi:hypothetical protein